MGNWFSYSTIFPISVTVDDIIEDIIWSKKFQYYQNRFESMIPSRDLYIDDNDLIIETNINNSYSMERISPNWNDPNIEKIIYNYLDKTYKKYTNTDIGYVFSNSSDSSSDNDDNNNDNNDEYNSEEIRIINCFINDSIKSDIIDWDEWLNKFFDNKSMGYQLFKRIGSSNCFRVSDKINGNIIYSLQFIWYSILQSIIDNGYMLILNQENTNEILLCDSDENCIVVMSIVDGEWKYVGITSKCLETIRSIYNKQC